MAFILKRKATRPTYVCQLLQNVGATATPNGEPVPNLDTASAIWFVARLQTAGEADPPDIEGQMDVLDPAEAILEYVWVMTDTDKTPDDFNIEVWIVWAPGIIEILPNDNFKVLTIKPSLNATLAA